MIVAVKLQDGVRTEKVAATALMEALCHCMRFERPAIELRGHTFKNPVPVARHEKRARNRGQMGVMMSDFMDEGNTLE
jgi:hypothetical protein